MDKINSTTSTTPKTPIAPKGYKHFSFPQLKQEKIKFLKSHNLSQQEIQTFLNSMPNSRNVQDIIKKLKLKPYEQQFLQYSIQEKPDYKKYTKSRYIKENSFLKFLNEFELEGEVQQGKPLWNGRDYLDKEGNISLTDMSLSELPCIFPEKWDKGFYCGNNQLTSLFGCPKYIGGSFNAGFNQLTSLENGPIKVGKNYIISNNELTSLKDIPNIINGDLYINSNEITLDGLLNFLPKVIKGDLIIYGNKDIFLGKKVMGIEKQIRNKCQIQGVIRA